MPEHAADFPERAEGGCLCGALRYVVEKPPHHVLHCHCHLCRRATGAPVITWLTVPYDAFRIVRGELRIFRSSSRAARGFCANCGTHLSFRHDDFPQEIDVTLGSLDQPELFRAQRHIWSESRLPWLDIDAHLPAEARESGSGS